MCQGQTLIGCLLVSRTCHNTPFVRHRRGPGACFANDGLGAYDWTIFIMGIGALGVALWFVRRRKEAYRGAGGVRVSDLGAFGVATGCGVGLSSLMEDLGHVPWPLMASGLVIGLALGVLASGRQTAKWELALQREGRLPPRVEAWWQSGWFLLALTASTLVIAVLLPSAISSSAISMNGLTASASYVLAGFFVGFGSHLSFWARKKQNQGFGPLKLPLRRR